MKQQVSIVSTITSIASSNTSHASPTAPHSPKDSPPSSKNARRSFTMHEYSIVQSLVDAVTSECGSTAGALVPRVHIEIGDLSGVDADLPTTPFEPSRPVPCCDHADLVIER